MGCSSSAFVPPVPTPQQIDCGGGAAACTVLTLNMLNEAHYGRYVNAKTPRLSAEQRKKKALGFFEAILGAYAAANDKNCLGFVCLQEFNPHDLSELSAMLDAADFGLLSSDGSMQRRAPGSPFSPTAPNAATDLVVLAYNRARFEPVGRPTIRDFVMPPPGSPGNVTGTNRQPQPGSKAMVMSLFHDKTTQKKLAVASVHVPFMPDAAGKAAMLQQIDALTAACPHGNFIVAGDFNLNADKESAVQALQSVMNLDPLYSNTVVASSDAAGNEAASPAVPSPWFEATRSVLHTAAGVHSESGTHKIDYVMFRGALVDRAAFALPADCQAHLLRHVGTAAIPPQAFFSDHAAVFVTFSYK